ncbi:MAG: cell wall hydrolase [Verrucomicrobiota bacterium]
MPKIFKFIVASMLLFTTAQLQARHGSLTHYDRLLLASCAVLEAASEGEKGMQAVLNVVYNRADGDIHRVIGVIARPKQFTALNSATQARNPDYGPIIERATSDPAFSDAYALVVLMERGELADITGGADHYHADYGETPYWTVDMEPTRKIGNHQFYRSDNDPALVALVTQ